jgi:hypothetical protein
LLREVFLATPGKWQDTCLISEVDVLPKSICAARKALLRARASLSE